MCDTVPLQSNVALKFGMRIKKEVELRHKIVTLAKRTTNFFAASTSDGKYNTLRASDRQTAEKEDQKNHPRIEGKQTL